jgi:hypothetical protein
MMITIGKGRLTHMKMKVYQALDAVTADPELEDPCTTEEMIRILGGLIEDFEKLGA